MVRKTLHTFKVEYLQVVDEKGKVDTKLMPKIQDKQLLEMYKTMVLARQFDIKMLAMQRQGRIATFASIQGQEGIQVAAMAALKKEDWIIPAFRETPALLARGAPLLNILLYTGGDERGSAVKGEQRELPTAIPVASQLCHAAGIAHGMKLNKKKTVAMVFFGDGATSEGDFHEALNWAGVYQLPCIFMCQNNQYAISTPVSRQTNAQTLAQKSIAYGIPGIQVDGNDVFSVFAAVSEAAARARAGKGPTLIENFTYRFEHHTTSDDSTRYRSNKEVEEWKKKGPIIRLKKYLIKNKKWSEAKEKKLHADFEKQIEKAVKEYEDSSPPPVEDMFKYMYEEMTPLLKEQLKDAERFAQ